jgi:hypothetical protein
MMQKTYLSRAMTRAMALDHPVGDATGGPAYGERRDPISAIISVGTMMATGGAVMAGTASLMTGLAFAGAAVSLVGNVTGNKTLSKIGMIAGLAGGVGMLAEGVMGSAIGGTMGETFGYGAGSAVNPAAAVAAPVDAGAGQALSNTPVAGAQTPVPVDAAAGSGLVNTPVTQGIEQATSASNAAQAVNTPGGATSALNAGPGAAMDPAFTGRTTTGLATVPGDAANVAKAPGFFDSVKAGNYMDAAKAAGSNVMDLAKSNPGAAMMMGNAVKGLSDWLSGKSDAEIAALEAQTGFADARAMQIQEEIAREKRRRTQLNTNMRSVMPGIQVNPNANLTPVNPATQFARMPAAPGLIAGARPPGG